MSIELLMLSNHLILCCPLCLLSSIFPSIRVFSNELAICIRWPKYWSFSISPSYDYSGLISFRIDWFDLAVQETLKSLLQHHNSKASILWHSAFFVVQHSHLYMNTGKTIPLNRWPFVGKVWLIALPDTYQSSRQSHCLCLRPQFLMRKQRCWPQKLSSPGKCIILSKSRDLSSELQFSLCAHSLGMVCHRQPHSLPFHRYAFHLVPAWQFTRGSLPTELSLNVSWCLCIYMLADQMSCIYIPAPLSPILQTIMISRFMQTSSKIVNIYHTPIVC